MPKFYIHDFKFEYKELENKINKNDFYCGVTVYYNFKPENPGDGFDDLEYFFISVATPFGLASYLSQCMRKGIFSKIYFSPHLILSETNNETTIETFIKFELESINGETERELILKAIRKFDWEGENFPEVYDTIFR